MNHTWQFLMLARLREFGWEIIRQHPLATLSFFLGVLGYRNAKRVYESSISPQVIPTSVDLRKHTVNLKNIGRGAAQNIKIGDYITLLDWFGSGIIEWKLSLETPAVLGPNEEKPVSIRAYENGKDIESKDLLFATTFAKKTLVRFNIEYRDIDGIRYLTRSFVRDGNFENISILRDSYHHIRDLLERTRNHFVRWSFMRKNRRSGTIPGTEGTSPSGQGKGSNAVTLK